MLARSVIGMMSGARKKVLYVITKSNWGGAQKYVFDLATNLPRENFEAAVAAGGSGLLIQKLKESGIRTISIPTLERDINIFKELLSLLGLFKIIKREKPDVVHLNSTKVGGLGAVAAWLYKITSNRLLVTIFTVHGWGFKEDRPFWQRWLIFFLTWLGSLFQDKIITINTADFETGKKFVPKERLHLIFNGIETFKFLSRENARRVFRSLLQGSDRWELSEQTLVIGSIAEYTKNKGLTEFLEALAEIKRRFPKLNWQAFLVGEGEDRKNLAQKITSLKLEGRVHLTGYLPEARQYLPGFDIFVLPSRKEGLPYAVMEAMSAKVPVLASSVGGIPDLIKNEEDGLLFQPKHTRELASAITRLANDQALRLRLGESASKKMDLQFRLKDMIDRTVTLYASE